MNVAVLRLAAFAVFAASFSAAQPSDGFEATFPQVASDASIETLLTIANPQPEAVQVQLESFGIQLPQGTASFDLQPGETRQILFSGQELQAGWVRLKASDALSASARLLTLAPDSGEILSQVTVLGQPRTSRAALPVFRNRPDLDETGVAVALFEPATLRLTLQDESGEMIAAEKIVHPASPTASRTSAPDNYGHRAQFLSELFPQLPESFQSGSLIIEQALPEGLPQGFAVLALYTRGNDLQSAPVQPLGTTGHYLLKLASLQGSGQQTAEDLAEQYSFRLDGPAAQPGEYFITAGGQSAGALSRDPRAESLQAAESQLLSFAFSFEEGAEGWEAGFADLPAQADPEFYELFFAPQRLPVQLGDEGALRIEGNNHSDDLFMYLKRRLTGLEPNTAYRLHFHLELATQAPRNASGVGGAPGEGVYVKAGASSTEPQTVVDELGDLRMNVDKGNQASGGANALVLGNIAKISTVFSDRFALKGLASGEELLEVATGDEGELWLLVGTDSAYEGKTVLYYNRIVVTLFRQ